MLVCPLHWYFRAAHLNDVVAVMRDRGRPTLRGHVVAGVVFLAEGTHRIRAALQLGLVPCIREVPWWRSARALTNAGFAAEQRGLWFDEIEIVASSVEITGRSDGSCFARAPERDRRPS